MNFKTDFTPKLSAKNDGLVLYVLDDRKMGAHARKLDEKLDGFLSHALKMNPKFDGKHGQNFTLTLPPKAPFKHAVFVGLGKAADLTNLQCEIAGAKTLPALRKIMPENVSLLLELDTGKAAVPAPDMAASIANGLALANYRFERYKTNKPSREKCLKNIEIVTAFPAKAQETYAALEITTQGVFFARDLVNEPPNDLHPESFARQIQKTLKPLGVGVEILDEKKMEKLGMGAALAVGMGSSRPPRMVVMRWNGTGKTTKKNAPLGFVGKGVTFDTGGISIKPGAGMEEMKMDMGGAAAVVGLMKALALRKSKAAVVAVVGLAENMPSDTAYRPGDILKSLSGKTIEILNTDAEGRLVLADALTYIQQKFKPRLIIDLATLTGAMMVALGHEYCGTFVNDDALWAKMDQAGKKSGEKLWRMPLDKVWMKEMESPVADLQNMAKSGRYAGACTAAGFLEHFIAPGTPWAHMDIAGTAWKKSDQPLTPKYGTGFGVRVLSRMIEDHYE